MELLRDDMIFKPYNSGSGGYQCKMSIKTGVISVRYGGTSLMTDDKRPYEVWFPNDDEPTGYQTAQDIWDYINTCYTTHHDNLLNNYN